MKTPTITMACGLALTALASAQIVDGPPPPRIAYTCDVEVYANGRRLSLTHLFFDNGKFREERVDLRTGKPMSMTVYNRDGQHISFLYARMSPLLAGVDLPGIMYRLARDNPDEFYRREGFARAARVVVPEPEPSSALRSFKPHPSSGYYHAGTVLLNGQRCDLYKTTATERPESIKVWRGYIVEQSTRFDRSVRWSRIKFVPQIQPARFELLPGTTVKVPRDLHVRLPNNVKRIEYPGNGLVVRSRAQSSTAAPQARP